MEFVQRGGLLKFPTKIGKAERYGARDSRSLIIIGKYYTFGVHKPPKIHQVKKYSVKKVAPIDKRKIKASPFTHESREPNLRFFGIVLN